MNFLGDYKVSKMMTMNRETEKMEFADVADVYEQMKAAGEDPHELQQMQFQMQTTLTVTENEMIYSMPIPEDAPADELEKARAEGMIVDDKLVYERGKCKIEDGALYMYDRSTFLTGSEWAKISTDTEGELNMVMAIWNKI